MDHNGNGYVNQRGKGTLEFPLAFTLPLRKQNKSRSVTTLLRLCHTTLTLPSTLPFNSKIRNSGHNTAFYLQGGTQNFTHGIKRTHVLATGHGITWNNYLIILDRRKGRLKQNQGISAFNTLHMLSYELTLQRIFSLTSLVTPFTVMSIQVICDPRSATS